MPDAPLAVLTATICGYWIGVGAMIVRVRRRTHRSVGVVPVQWLERLMWIVWIPLVAAWIYVPWATLAKAGRVPALPDFAMREPYHALRWIAAGLALASLAATVKCWARMGTDWRMDVAPERRTDLITDGLYARIRHPIYAFSILLMLSTLVIVPTPPVALIAATHIVLMNLKARNEERHLAAIHGETYLQYMRRSGRFVPRLS
jgi:protein-S-isoprenylcysteine O-methyltransferase Ste14